MNLIEAFEGDLVEGFSKPDREIETVISRLFFYENKVCKVYKHMQSFIGDMTIARFRKEFYLEDFSWNNIVSPNVYLELVGVKKQGDKYVKTEKDPEDYFILMEKVDSDANLIDLLSERKVSDKNLTDIVEVLVPKLKELTTAKRSKIDHISSQGWPELLKQNYEDLRSWSYMADAHIPREQTNEIVDVLSKFSEHFEFIKNFNTDKLYSYVDGHAGNIFVVNDKITFMDIYPPKESWRVADMFYTINRPITDVAVLLGQDKADIMYAKLEELTGEFPAQLKLLYTIHDAQIMAAYFHMLHKHELAEKYFKFVEENLKKLV